jgi:predicted Zn finger-like uncharacterized protein
MNVSCPDCRSIFRVDPAKVPPAGVRARCSVCSGVITIPAPTGQTTPSAAAPRSPTASAPPAESGRSTPDASGGWNTPPFGAPSRQTQAPAPVQRPAPAQQPPRPPETPAASRPAPDMIDRAPATATATPPSPTAGLPELTAPPPVPPFTARPVAPPTPPATAPSSGPPSGPGPFVPQSAPSRPAPPPSPAPVRQADTPTSPSSGVGARRPVNPFLSKDPDQRAKRLARALVSDIITYHPAKHAEGLRDGTLKQLFREEIKKSFEEYIAQVGQPLAEGTTYFQEALNEVLAAGKRIF